MSRDGLEPPPDPEDEPGQEPVGPGHVHNTGPGPLIGFALTGLVLGWLLRPVGIRINGSAPTLGWLQVLVLFFVAAIIAGTAWLTWRSLHKQQQRMEPHRAVNRLVLAKSCALVGALVAGGYFGYALSFLGRVDTDLDRDRVIHSVLAGVAGVLIVIGSLLLERACRVRSGGDRDLP